MLLGVNIDHVATLRQARLTSYPDPVLAALEIEKAGSDSITLHLREDRRHIQEMDVLNLKKVLKIPINLEMAITDEMVEFASNLRPEYCCLVPEKREELTTEGGLDVFSQESHIRDICTHLQNCNIRVSLFIDADQKQIDAATNTGARAIEIHTGHYADAASEKIATEELNRVIAGVKLGLDAGLMVNAGHGLNYDNVSSIANIHGIHELNIGHSIIARSVFVGLPLAVKEMQELIKGKS